MCGRRRGQHRRRMHDAVGRAGQGAGLRGKIEELCLAAGLPQQGTA